MSFVSQSFFDAMWEAYTKKPSIAGINYCPSCNRDAWCLKPKHLRMIAWVNKWNISFRWNRACLECGWVSIHTRVANEKLRAAVYEADDRECVYCGSRERLGLDHVVSQVRGGKHTFENLLTCCHQCNSVKKDRNAPTPQYGRFRKAAP